MRIRVKLNGLSGELFSSHSVVAGRTFVFGQRRKLRPEAVVIAAVDNDCPKFSQGHSACSRKNLKETAREARTDGKQSNVPNVNYLDGIQRRPDKVRRRVMDDTIKPLIALGVVFFVLLALYFVNPNFDRSLAAFADSASSVSELGLRFSFQR